MSSEPADEHYDGVALHYREGWEGEWRAVTIMAPAHDEQLRQGVMPPGTRMQILTADAPMTKERATVVAKEWLAQHGDAPVV